VTGMFVFFLMFSSVGCVFWWCVWDGVLGCLGGREGILPRHLSR